MRRSDVTEVIDACDAGREGELIFRNVYYLAGCTKTMKRLWISSMEDEAIRDGFADLKPGSAIMTACISPLSAVRKPTGLWESTPQGCFPCSTTGR
jgi:DNA topoisomerase IA